MSENQDILLARWLSGEITKDELTELRSTVDLDELKSVLDAQSTLELETQSTEDGWQSLLGKTVATRDKTVGEGLSPKYQVESSNGSQIQWLWIALLLLGICGAAFALWPKGDKLRTSSGETIEYAFIDNSSVILAPGSNLKYDESKWDDRRQVKLTGQAYFEVSKGATFTVETKQGTVTVLGTQFEVWERDDQMRVSCIEGRVRVNLGAAQLEITAGEYVTSDGSNLSAAQNHNQTQAQFLMDRQVYDEIRLSALRLEMERFYPYSVQLPTNTDTSRFSGVLILDDVERAADYIARPMGWKYDITEDKIRFSHE